MASSAVVPLVTRHGAVSREPCSVRIKPGGTASGPRPEQARAILSELRVASYELRVDRRDGAPDQKHRDS